MLVFLGYGINKTMLVINIKMAWHDMEQGKKLTNITTGECL
jgi:hypothetical protein